jgi:hypothetical protein
MGAVVRPRKVRVNVVSSAILVPYRCTK